MSAAGDITLLPRELLRGTVTWVMFAFSERLVCETARFNYDTLTLPEALPHLMTPGGRAAPGSTQTIVRL